MIAAGGMVLGEQSSAPQIRPCGENFEAKAEDTSDNVNSVGILSRLAASNSLMAAI